MKDLLNLLRLVAVALVGAAVYRELQKPPEARTWHGRIGGFVPYDFRPPTVDTLRAAYWNPDDPRVFTDRVFGVGWGINFPSLYHCVRDWYDQLSGSRQG